MTLRISRGIAGQAFESLARLAILYLDRALTSSSAFLRDVSAASISVTGRQLSFKPWVAAMYVSLAEPNLDLAGVFPCSIMLHMLSIAEVP
ncbi:MULTISPECIES: hypothetical protein [unclassified Mesorhizobium]|uniref:hypothetical protein n=1 Tax=unclassified Mesorhizobium TaxID=325217 RepID=UPI00112E26DD|nr:MULTISPECIES: hypothetical protein [unclassified Mesorhizobium]MBZ9739735.1 hypothetical protein [Mesorhizobium sp. CO1-1-4]MBZ9805001.1 hypothetical protein [Mesorhizobium sp. ES1-6]TPL88742.1 hypothetical protein FJ948_21315 [Mesorhizobium sp. B2-3-12]